MLQIAKGEGPRPVEEVEGRLDTEFRHTMGACMERFFDGLAEKKILGLRCTGCGAVLVPPRSFCSFCFSPAEEWVELSDEGRIMTYSLVYTPFPGQPTEPPYVYAFIVLDGADVHVPHIIGEADPADLAVGMRVKAKWATDRKGTLHDIEYFRPSRD